MAHTIADYNLNDPASVAKYHVYASKGVTNNVVGQITQRLDLIQRWEIKTGDRVLEVGCGQGDCTVALAAAVGPEGHITGLDPAPLDYGSPYNLGQAQEHIKAGALGARVTFVQDDPLDYIANHASERYDVAILAQSSWYFPTPAHLQATLRAVASIATRVCFSEYALSSLDPCASAHVLAVLAQAALECRKPTSESNVRTVLSPAALTALVNEAGLRLVRESILAPPEHMYDGRWEVSAVEDPTFVEDLEKYVQDQREKAVVYALRDAVLRARDTLSEGKRVRTMDIWVAEFVTS